MKKIVALLIAFTFLLSSYVSVFAETSEQLNLDSDLKDQGVNEQIDDQLYNSSVANPSEDEDDLNLEESTLNENSELNEIVSQMNELSDKNIDFYSQRLIVKGNKGDIKDEPVIANLGDVYLLQYDSIEDAISSYYRLLETSDSVEFDSSMSIASGSIGIGITTSNDDVSIMTEEENPFVEIDEVRVEKTKYDIAVIDTGSNTADKIVSVLGDDGKDSNGHGQKMVDTIKNYAPDAKVLSIKAISNDGIGDISAVYAAIKLAIDEKVDIINLSISALATEDNFIIEEVIAEAQNKGIKVVGAAGNNGIDASLTIPGKINDAIIVGTTNEASNTGDTVDYYLPASSTSVATAIISGLIFSDTLKDYTITDKVIDIKLDNGESNSSEPSNEFKPQGDGGGGGSQSGSFSGSSTIAETQPIIWRWWDRYYDRETQEPMQGGFRNGNWVNNNAGTHPIDYWIGLITEKYRTKSSNKYNYSRVTYGVPKGAKSSEDKFRKAAKEACQNAIARSGRSNATARIVGVAVTTLYDNDTHQWWFRGHSASDGWSKYHNMLPRAPHSSEVLPWGNDEGWNSIVVPNATNGANGTERWPEYVYRKGYEDVGDVNIKNGERYIVIAVTDDQPPSEVPVQIKKKFGTKNTSDTVINRIVANNPLYSLNGIVFRLYDTQAHAIANGSAGIKASFTTNANGVSEVVKVAPGNYYLVEVGPPKLGVIIPDVLKAENGGKLVKIAGNTTINITDTPATGTYNVNYRYEGNLPAEVMATLPQASTAENESVVTAANPSSTEIEIGNTLYVFSGWDAAMKSINSADITFVGTWDTEDRTPIGEDSDARRAIYQYEIEDWPEDVDLPEEILATLPVDLNEDEEYNVYFTGDTVISIRPSETIVVITNSDNEEVTYVFMGWDHETITVEDDTDIVFTGTWQKVEDDSSGSGTGN